MAVDLFCILQTWTDVDTASDKSVHGALDPITLGRSLEEIRYKHRLDEPRQRIHLQFAQLLALLNRSRSRISVVMIRVARVSLILSDIVLPPGKNHSPSASLPSRLRPGEVRYNHSH